MFKSTLITLETAVAAAILVRVAADAVDGGRRRSPSTIPAAAAALGAAVGLPSLLQLGWPQLLPALRCDPGPVLHHGEVWRLATALAVQDGGVAGTVFNLVMLGIVAALASWFWGGRRAVGLFVGAGIALDVVATAFGAVAAGSSGATFALAASVAGGQVVRSRGSARRRAAAPLALGAIILASGNAHGLAVLVGGAAGIALASAQPERDGAPRRAAVSASSGYPRSK